MKIKNLQNKIERYLPLKILVIFNFILATFLLLIFKKNDGFDLVFVFTYSFLLIFSGYALINRKKYFGKMVSTFAGSAGLLFFLYLFVSYGLGVFFISFTSSTPFFYIVNICISLVYLLYPFLLIVLPETLYRAEFSTTRRLIADFEKGDSNEYCLSILTKIEKIRDNKEVSFMLHFLPHNNNDITIAIAKSLGKMNVKAQYISQILELIHNTKNEKFKAILYIAISQRSEAMSVIKSMKDEETQVELYEYAEEYKNLGDLYFNLKKYEESEKWYKLVKDFKGLDKVYKITKDYLKLANLCKAEKRFNEAGDAYYKLKMYDEAGNCYWEGKSFIGLQKVYKKNSEVLILKKLYVLAKNDKQYAFVGECYYKLKNYEMSEQCYDLAEDFDGLEKNYQITEQYVKLAELYESNEMNNLAYDNYLKAFFSADNGAADDADESSAVQDLANIYSDYNLRDIGPAGGIIFFDKGNNSDGWRYLEVAPVSTEITDVEWPVDNNEVLWDFGGYSDWFIPNLDELSKMFINLKKGTDENGNQYTPVGDFSNLNYWSSSSENNTRGALHFLLGYKYVLGQGDNATIRVIRSF